MATNGVTGTEGAEDFEVTNFNEEFANFDQVVSHIQDILVEDSFQNLLRNFYEKYSHEFDYSEENKLQYTSIFQEYVAVIESYMTRTLMSKIPGFNMSEFISEISSRQEELEGEVFEVLSSFADFLTFKQLILDYKAVQEGLVADMTIGSVTAT